MDYYTLWVIQDRNEQEKQTMHVEENRLLQLFHVEHKADRHDGQI